jgi:hypothetical protein
MPWGESLSPAEEIDWKWWLEITPSLPLNSGEANPPFPTYWLFPWPHG